MGSKNVFQPLGSFHMIFPSLKGLPNSVLLNQVITKMLKNSSDEEFYCSVQRILKPITVIGGFISLSISLKIFHMS